MRWRSIAGLALLAAWTAPVLAHAAGPDLIGFYAPWDKDSLASLQQHADDLQAVVPAWVSVTGVDHKVTLAADPTGRAALSALSRRPRLLLMVQNALLGAWDGAGAATLLRDPVATRTVLDQIEAEALSDKAAGLVVDFEDLPAGRQPDLVTFLAAARERCRRHRWTLSVTAPVGNPDVSLAALAKVSDRLILMAYDEHWQSGSPGPIASNPWFSDVVHRAIAQLAPTQAIVAIASYAYDWPAGGPASILSIAQAKALAAQYGVALQRDPTSGAGHFTYDANGVSHEVWLSDGATVHDQDAIARASGVRSIALWRLGTEDPALWPSR